MQLENAVTTIEQQLRKLIVDKFGVKDNQLAGATSFVEDLGADSLDNADLVLAMEDEFQLDIPDEDALQLTTIQRTIDYLTAAMAHEPALGGAREPARPQTQAARAGDRSIAPT